jgi:biopolymer transport protein ExbD
MPLKTEPLDEPGINLTSMLDVVMLLIIFFMIGTKFSEEERQTDIMIPTAADVSTMTGSPDEIVINVTFDGKFMVKGAEFTSDSLNAMLRSAQAGFPNQAVVIRGDGRCPYQLIMDAFSSCKEAGIRNISVAHLPKKQGS